MTVTNAVIAFVGQIGAARTGYSHTALSAGCPDGERRSSPSAQEVGRDVVDGADRIARADERAADWIGQRYLAEAIAHIPPRRQVLIGDRLAIGARRVHLRALRDDIARIEPVARTHVEDQHVAAATVLSLGGRHGGRDGGQREETQGEKAAHEDCPFYRSAGTRRLSLSILASRRRKTGPPSSARNRARLKIIEPASVAANGRARGSGQSGPCCRPLPR